MKPGREHPPTPEGFRGGCSSTPQETLRESCRETRKKPARGTSFAKQLSAAHFTMPRQKRAHTIGHDDHNTLVAPAAMILRPKALDEGDDAIARIPSTGTPFSDMSRNNPDLAGTSSTGGPQMPGGLGVARVLGGCYRSRPAWV